MPAPGSSSSGEVQVKLDGLPVEVPAERRSLAAIRSFLELLALQQQRILCSLNVNGQAVHLTQPPPPPKILTTVEAETMSLAQMPIQLVKAALQQTANVRSRVQSAIE